ncbi:VOC family protein [Roseobacter sp. HKCCA0434]|uniref:VOC family protein n=1 Tax=Roseobacter sp. HKCCA0434 TaxID=3079297 RepID=UPI0029059B5F|nr:VOC family protein [Roseobacter sp. HKCCA0434]
MQLTGIDHVVLTVRDIEAAVAFYERVLGAEVETFGGGRKALKIGSQKINLQTLGQETRNHAAIGCGDVCLLTSLSSDAVVSRLHRESVEVVEGPVAKTGARGPISSVYFNDPDGNLIEIASYD